MPNQGSPLPTTHLTDLSTACLQTLSPYPTQKLLIGYSGGRDSHVLLTLLTELKQAGKIKNDLVAIHINHQLQSAATAWAKHCQTICNHYSIPLIIATVTSRPKSGDSIEAFARNARYHLIKQYLDEDTIFLSAHHQSDQAETVLLQLMRGAGLEGLRAMPTIKPFGTGYYLRPLLHVKHSDITAYAEQHQLHFIDDSSNADTRFDRNYIRHEILPLLKQRFPTAEQNIARSAAWLSEIPDTRAPSTLLIDTLKQLPLSEQKQTIRNYIKGKTAHSLTQTQTQYIIQHHLSAAPDKHPTLLIGQYVVRRHQGEIIITEQLPENIEHLFYQETITLREEKVFSPFSQLAWQSGEGLLLNNESLTLKPLSGRDRFHPHNRTHSQTIKKLMAEYHIPPWLRSLTPGIYLANELVAIPNIGVAQKYYHKSVSARMPLWQISPKFVKI